MDPFAWAHVQKAQELLETHGPEMARLSLYLPMHICGHPDPTAPFLVEGEDRLKDFALNGTSGGHGQHPRNQPEHPHQVENMQKPPGSQRPEPIPGASG
ncbi:hypothetical protein OMCYN_01731 [cyanobiont of Ornithocercus magnificus]|nr:hypothetical protein OMCYN_01731 [cyanobiont of Ornithocercus magnificus]